MIKDRKVLSPVRHSHWRGVVLKTVKAFGIGFPDQGWGIPFPDCAYFHSLIDLDVYVYWTYNCTGYANSTEPFQEWTSTCKTGPIAKPVVEHELLSMARECSMNMTTDFPMSRVQGRFSVQCVRQEGFETVPADADALLKVILLFVIYAVLGFLIDFPWLWRVYRAVGRIKDNAVRHLESCSSCSLDSTFGSSDHLPLVKYQIVKGSVRNHLILQTISALLLVALLAVTSSVLLLLTSDGYIIALPCVLIPMYSLIGLVSALVFYRKAFILLEVIAGYKENFGDAAAVKARYEEQCSGKPFWYPLRQRDLRNRIFQSLGH